MSVDQERSWWDGLAGDDVDANVLGYPPYDIDTACERIVGALGPTSGFARLLDLGCGTGRLTSETALRLASHVEVVGVDISKAMIDRAKRWPANNVVYRVGDGRQLPEGVGMFDGAWSVTMFQHIPHDAKMAYLADVCQHLRPGSKFIFTVAVGDENSFLNHQLNERELDEFCGWATTLFDVVTVSHQTYAPFWTWIEVRK